MSTVVTSWEGAEAFTTIFPGWTLFPWLGIFMAVVFGWLFYIAFQRWQFKEEDKELKNAVERFHSGEFDPLLSTVMPLQAPEAEEKKPKHTAA